jgi:hypothetical protein
MRLGTKLGLAALLVAVGTAVSWFHLAGQVSLPENRSGFVVLWLAAFALGVTALFKRPGILGAIPAVLAMVIGLFLPFTVYISPQTLGDRAIEVGDTIPHFTAPDEYGEIFDSSSLNGHLVLIKFFRAHW